MIALWIVLAIIVLFCILIFFGSAKIRIAFSGKLCVTASVAGIRIPLYPGKKKKQANGERDLSASRNPDAVARRELRRQQKIAAKLEKKRRKAARKAEKRLRNQKERSISSGVPAPNLKENMEMILTLVKRLYQETRGRLRIRIHRCHLSVGTDDAAKTAILYGVCAQSVAYLLALVKKAYPKSGYHPEDVSVTPDFVSGTSEADLLVVCSVRLFRLIGIGIRMLFAYSREKQKAQKKAIRRGRASLRSAP